jgi:hypothetical protein
MVDWKRDAAKSGGDEKASVNALWELVHAPIKKCCFQRLIRACSRRISEELKLYIVFYLVMPEGRTAPEVVFHHSIDCMHICIDVVYLLWTHL